MNLIVKLTLAEYTRDIRLNHDTDNTYARKAPIDQDQLDAIEKSVLSIEMNLKHHINAIGNHTESNYDKIEEVI